MEGRENGEEECWKEEGGERRVEKGRNEKETKVRTRGSGGRERRVMEKSEGHERGAKAETKEFISNLFLKD